MNLFHKAGLELNLVYFRMMRRRSYGENYPLNLQLLSTLRSFKVNFGVYLSGLQLLFSAATGSCFQLKHHLLSMKQQTDTVSD